MENYLLLGSIIFFGMIIYSFKRRQGLYNNKIPCNIIYIPEKEDIITKKIDKLIKENDLKKYHLRENKYQKK